MLAASRARPPDAARISATPHATDTKNAYWWETPRRRGFTGAGASTVAAVLAAGLTGAR